MHCESVINWKCHDDVNLNVHFHADKGINFLDIE